MTDHDVTLEFTVPDRDYDSAGNFVNEVMAFITNRTEFPVFCRMTESKPEADERKPTDAM